MNDNSIIQRLASLEAEQAIRKCMNRYMYLCDELGEKSSLDDLTDLFTDNAVWEGVGSRYKKTLGRHQRHHAIEEMFSKYTKAPPYFSLNVHVLANELIEVNGDDAQGSWILLQPSSFTCGKSQLSCARIKASFKCINGSWLINHFQTECLFSRPVADPWDQAVELPVPE